MIDRSAMSLLVPLSLLLLGCPAEDEELPPPPPNATGAVTSGGSSADDTDTGDLPVGCDPFGDPLVECGVDQECDLELLTCVPALGQGAVDEPCVDEGDCAPGLACVSELCSQPCDIDLEEGACAEGQICSPAPDPVPGICVSECSLVDQDCGDVDEACNRVLGPFGVTFAGCTPNPGAAQLADACEFDEDCDAGLLCTPNEDHAIPCPNDAASCCASVCDSMLLPCVGAEPICFTLAIPGQVAAGYCGGTP